MDPLGTNMYLLKRYRPSDSFWTCISESVSSVEKCDEFYLLNIEYFVSHVCGNAGQFNRGSQILHPSPVSFQRKRVISLRLSLSFEEYQQGISEDELEPHCASERTCYCTE